MVDAAGVLLPNNCVRLNFVPAATLLPLASGATAAAPLDALRATVAEGAAAALLAALADGVADPAAPAGATTEVKAAEGLGVAPPPTDEVVTVPALLLLNSACTAGARLAPPTPGAEVPLLDEDRETLLNAAADDATAADGD